MTIYQGKNAKLYLSGTEIGFTGSFSISTEGGDEMNMRKAIEHTRMRFDKMTERQLWNRMGKMSVLTKLEAFAVVAEERGYPDLAVAASARLARMSSGGVIGQPTRASAAGTRLRNTLTNKTVLKTTKKGKLLRRMDTA